MGERKSCGRCGGIRGAAQWIVGGAEPGSQEASSGAISARLQQDGAREVANESSGRGFMEASWKPSVFRLSDVFANNTILCRITTPRPLWSTDAASMARANLALGSMVLKTNGPA